MTDLYFLRAHPGHLQFGLALLLAALGALPSWQTQAYAQQRAPSAQQTAVLPPIFAVSASHEDQNRFTTASSLSIINRQTLEEQHLDTLGEIAHRQPNMHLTSYSHANPIITIRGLGVHVDESDSTNIPVLLDGVPLPSNLVGQLFDLDHVQVLRGPQLFQGPNGLGGLVNMRSRDPGKTAAGNLSLEYGSQNRRRGTMSGDIPLSERTGLRIAIGREQSDGNTNNTTLGRDDTAGWKSTLGKLKFLHEDSAGGQWRLGLYHMNLRGANDYFASERLSRKHESNMTEEGANNTKYTLLSGSYQRQFVDGTRLTARLGASRSEWNYWLPNSLFRARTGFDMVTRELIAHLRLSGYRDATDWTVGLFAQQARRNAPYLFDMAPYFTSRTEAQRKGHTLALYGQVGWRWSFAWRLAAGLRIQYDRQRLNWRSDQSGFVDSNGDGIPDMPFSTRQAVDHASITKTTLLPSLTLQYRPNERHFGWLKLSRGYEPAGFNLNATVRERAQYAYRPTLANYVELGYRIRGQNESWELGATAFGTVLHDHQVVGSVNGLIVTNNAPRAHSRGIELTGMWRPLSQLELTAFAGFVDAKWDDFVVNGVDYAGQSFSTTPRQNYGLGMSWQPDVQ